MVFRFLTKRFFQFHVNTLTSEGVLSTFSFEKSYRSAVHVFVCLWRSEWVSMTVVNQSRNKEVIKSISTLSECRKNELVAMLSSLRVSVSY